jgi:hypothetical protein
VPKQQQELESDRYDWEKQKHRFMPKQKNGQSSQESEKSHRGSDLPRPAPTARLEMQSNPDDENTVFNQASSAFDAYKQFMRAKVQRPQTALATSSQYRRELLDDPSLFQDNTEIISPPTMDPKFSCIQMT